MNHNKETLQYWRARIQDYLDDTLPRQEAVEFFLYAQKHPELQAELDSYRELVTQLQEMPHAQPGADFDTPVLASLPLERYESKPRLAERVLVIGDEQPTLVQRTAGRVSRGMLAVSAAYVLFLAVSHSFLAQTATKLAGAVGDSLHAAAARTQTVPVLSTVVDLSARGYDAVVASVASIETVLGPGLLTMGLGIVVGVAAWGVMSGARRRQIARRTHAS